MMPRYFSQMRNWVRTARTQQRYQRALGRFERWCKGRGLRLRTAEEADDALQMYADGLFAERAGKGRSVAATAVAALQARRPELRGKLTGAQEALFGWGRRVPTVSYPPMARHLAVLCCVWLARQGQWRAGAAVMVAFEGLLRVSEIAALKVEDILLPGDDRADEGVLEGATLCLQPTKTGRDQSVEIRDPGVIRMLRMLMAGRKAGDRLVGLGPAQLRTALQRACNALGLPPGYVFHSLRHGKATLLVLQGTPFEDIRIIGRWRSPKSVEIYLQQAKARLRSRQVPAEVAAVSKRMAKDCWHWFAAAVRKATA